MCVETPTWRWNLSERLHLRVWSGRQEKQGKQVRWWRVYIHRSQQQFVPPSISPCRGDKDSAVDQSTLSASSTMMIGSLGLGLYLISWGITGPCMNSLSLLPDLLPKPVPAGQAFSGPQDVILWCGTLPVLCYDRSGQHRLSPDWIFFQGQQDLEIKKLLASEGWLMLAFGDPDHWQEEAGPWAMMTALLLRIGWEGVTEIYVSKIV